MTPRPLDRTTRRQFLSIAAAAAGSVALASCSTEPRTSSGGSTGGGGAATGGTGGTGNLKWWDQFNPLQNLQKSTFAAFTQAGGPQVDYTVYNPNDQGKALQLAFSSGQLPDVFSLAGLSSPPAVLLQQKWFAPIQSADAAQITKAMPGGALVEGVHLFGGALYSFPIFSYRFYDALVWSNRGLLQKAGIDPDAPLASYDQVRAAARKVQQSGTSGIILPLQFADRMAAFVAQLANAAGFPGVQAVARGDGLNVKTGEYAFDDDTFVGATEFLLSFQKDGVLFPASTSLDARAARARWVANSAGYFFDGQYNVGVVKGSFASFLPQLAVGGIPTPDGRAPVLAHAPSGGTFWVSAQSNKVDKASQLLVRLTSKEYQAGLAESMDTPPLDIDAVASSNAHPTFKKAVELFKKQVFLGPTPEARNPKISQTIGAMAPVDPSLGAIIQGAFSGQITDVKGALKKLSDDTNAARDAAITKSANGVTRKDWAFPNFTPGRDFTAQDYKG